MLWCSFENLCQLGGQTKASDNFDVARLSSFIQANYTTSATAAAVSMAATANGSSSNNSMATPQKNNNNSNNNSNAIIMGNLTSNNTSNNVLAPVINPILMNLSPSPIQKVADGNWKAIDMSPPMQQQQNHTQQLFTPVGHMTIPFNITTSSAVASGSNSTMMTPHNNNTIQQQQQQQQQSQSVDNLYSFNSIGGGLMFNSVTPATPQQQQPRFGTVSKPHTPATVIHTPSNQQQQQLNQGINSNNNNLMPPPTTASSIIAPPMYGGNASFSVTPKHVTKPPSTIELFQTPPLSSFHGNANSASTIVNININNNNNNNNMNNNGSAVAAPSTISSVPAVPKVSKKPKAKLRSKQNAANGAMRPNNINKKFTKLFNAATAAADTPVPSVSAFKSNVDNAADLIQQTRERGGAIKQIDMTTFELNALSSLFSSLGEAYRCLCQFKCKEALQHFSSLPLKHYHTAWVLSNVGRTYFELADYKRAESEFEKMSKLEPHALEGLEIYSTVLWHLKKEKNLSYLAQRMSAVSILILARSVLLIIGFF